MTQVSWARVAPFDSCDYGPCEIGRLHRDEIAALDVGPRLLAVGDADAERGRTLLDGHRSEAESVLTLTRAWTAALVLEQHSSLGNTTTVGYLRADGYGLVEDVDPDDGHHRFVLAKVNAVLDNLVGALAPFEYRHDQQGFAIEYDVEDWEYGYRRDWGPAHVVSMVLGVHRRSVADPTVDERRLSAFAYPDRTIVALPTAEGGLSVAKTSRRQLRRYLHALVDPLRKPLPEHP